MTETPMTQDTFEQRIDELAERIKGLKRKSESAKGEARKSLEGELEKLQFKTEQLKNQVKVAGQAGKQSWTEIKEGAERAWGEIKKGYDRALSQLN